MAYIITFQCIGNANERKDNIMLKTTYEDVQTIVHYMWPDEEFSTLMLHQLKDFINTRHSAIGCCVIHRLSKSYRQFASKFGMPAVNGHQEIIICQDGTVQYTPHTFLKGTRKIHKIASAHAVKVIKT